LLPKQAIIAPLVEETMRGRRNRLKAAWIVLCILGSFPMMWPSADTATSADLPVVEPLAVKGKHVLTEIRVVYRDGQWRVVLRGSRDMKYRISKAVNPLRVVVDLPNTACRPTIVTPATPNEVIAAVRATTLVTGSQPLTEVEIRLLRDTPFRAGQDGEYIQVLFDTGRPPSEATTAEVDSGSTRAKSDISPAPTPSPQQAIGPRSVQEGPLSPPTASPATAPAAKILAIEPVSTDKVLKVYVRGNGRLAQHRVFRLGDPPRIVVDLLGVTSSEVEGPVPLPHPLAAKVRVGLHGDRVRLVFDLIPGERVSYQVTSQGDQLVVTLMSGPGLSSLKQ
jgi:hypothetical protein